MILLLKWILSQNLSEHYKRSAYKINAVILLGSGWTLGEVKDALLIDDETLGKRIMQYNNIDKINTHS